MVYPIQRQLFRTLLSASRLQRRRRRWNQLMALFCLASVPTLAAFPQLLPGRVAPTKRTNKVNSWSQRVGRQENPTISLNLPPIWPPLWQPPSGSPNPVNGAASKSNTSGLGSAIQPTFILKQPDTTQSNTKRKAKLPQPKAKNPAEDDTMMLSALAGSVGVLFILGMDGNTATTGQIPNFEAVTRKVLESSIPSNAYDFVAVTVGETVAGFLGAAASLGINLLLLLQQQKQPTQQLEKKRGAINQAVAEADYFYAQAAIMPLLELVGLSPSFAVLTSSMVATLPYELVKFGNERREAISEERKIMMQMLQDNQAQLRADKKQFPVVATLAQTFQNWSWNSRKDLRLLAQPQGTTVDPSTLEPAYNVAGLDGVTLFSDTCKWLSYSVLMADFSGQFLSDRGLESAWYGTLATLTSQLYADVLYVYFQQGPVAKQLEAKRRTIDQWIQLYLAKSLTAFALFGVYQSVQLPVRIAVNALLSGGVDSCVGSADVDACMSTYMANNPPGPSLEAQIRALATTVTSLLQMPTANAPSADAAAELRALVTTLVSLWNRIA